MFPWLCPSLYPDFLPSVPLVIWQSQKAQTSVSLEIKKKKKTQPGSIWISEPCQWIHNRLLSKLSGSLWHSSYASLTKKKKKKTLPPQLSQVPAARCAALALSCGKKKNMIPFNTEQNSLAASFYFTFNVSLHKLFLSSHFSLELPGRMLQGDHDFLSSLPPSFSLSLPLFSSCPCSLGVFSSPRGGERMWAREIDR